MEKLQFINSGVLGSVSLKAIDALAPEAEVSFAKLTDGSGAGADFLGWVDLATRTPDSLVDDIMATAAQLRRDCDVIVAIGIGGSYLGAKAVIEALNNSFDAYIPAAGPKVLFAGQNIGEDYLYEPDDFEVVEEGDVPVIEDEEA